MVGIPNPIEWIFGGGRNPSRGVRAGGGGRAASGDRGGKRARSIGAKRDRGSGVTREDVDRLMRTLNPILSNPALMNAFTSRPPDFGGGGVDLPPLTLAPLPNRDAYTGPYDRATLVAHDAHNKAVPEINSIFDDLQGALQSRQQAHRQDIAQGRQQAAQEQQALMAQSQALTAPTGLAQALGPGADQQSQAAAEADRAFLNMRAADEAQASRRMERADTEAAADLQQGSEAVRAGSLDNARANLDTILTQLGLGKAQAEQQFQQDVARTQAENAQRQFEYATLRQQMEQDQLQLAQEREAMWADEQERIARTALTSGRHQWDQELDARMSRYPNGTAAMMDIIEASGTGPTGRANALRLLNDWADDLSSGKVTDPETGDTLYGGKKLRVDILRDWIEQFYDENEIVDPRAYMLGGGDPSYLAVRDRYAR